MKSDEDMQLYYKTGAEVNFLQETAREHEGVKQRRCQEQEEGMGRTEAAYGVQVLSPNRLCIVDTPDFQGRSLDFSFPFSLSLIFNVIKLQYGRREYFKH